MEFPKEYAPPVVESLSTKVDAVWGGCSVGSSPAAEVNCASGSSAVGFSCLAGLSASGGNCGFGVSPND